MRQAALMLYGHLGLITGGFIYDRILVDYLNRRGVKVEVMALPWRPYRSGGLLRNVDPNFLRRFRNFRTDIIIQDELIHPSVFLANRLVRRRQPAPMVSLVHHLRSLEAHPPGRRWLYRHLERLYLSTVDGFIFNSESTRKSVEALLDRSRPFVVAYPAGDRFQKRLSPGEIEARCQKKGPLRLLFLGNLIPRKGLHTLLEALKLVPPEGWCLTVVGDLYGDPGYARGIRNRVEDRGWLEKVRFTGVLQEEEVVRVLEQNDLLVVPSTYEAFGMAYLEGMAFGLPAVATLAGGAREIITHGQNGFLIPPENPAALAQHLQTLIDDRRLLLKMSLAARERFERHPTWEESCEAIYCFLIKMVETGGRHFGNGDTGYGITA